jgi:hypothetical protein
VLIKTIRKVFFLVQKFEIENGNTLLYLELPNKDGIINNVLVLSGGDVLFLKTEGILPLWKKDIQDDLEKLDCENFAKKYNVPISSDLFAEIRNGLETGEYPRYLKK